MKMCAEISLFLRFVENPSLSADVWDISSGPFPVHMFFNMSALFPTLLLNIHGIHSETTPNILLQ